MSTADLDQLVSELTEDIESPKVSTHFHGDDNDEEDDDDLEPATGGKENHKKVLI